jgi:hypothetical protein
MRSRPAKVDGLKRLEALVRLAVICLSLIWILSGCSHDEYSAEAIEAQVVDADSGAPLEAVNVIAAWQLRGGLEAGNIEGYLEVREAVTDPNGVFRIPAWGPKVKRQGGGVAEAAPRFMLFKPGYKYRSVANRHPPQRGQVLQSDWNGRTITMQRFTGSALEYKEELHRLPIDLENLHRYVGDYWPQIPRFLCAGARLERSLAAQGAPNALPSYEEFARDKGPRCELPLPVAREQRE